VEEEVVVAKGTKKTKEVVVVGILKMTENKS